MTEIIFVCGKIFFSSSAGLTVPVLSTDNVVTVQPKFFIAEHEFKIALCSTADVMIFGRAGKFASTEDFIA